MPQEFDELPIPYKQPSEVAAQLQAVLLTQAAIKTASQGSLVFDVKAAPYHATGDGTTDDSAAVIAAIQSAYDAGGGVVYFPPGVYRIDSQLAIPNTGTGATFQQPPITLRGVGTRWSGDLISGSIASGASVLDLRFSGDNAKILTMGIGTLRLERIALVDNGTSTTPFVMTTATTIVTDDVFVRGNLTKQGSNGTCDQDAFVLGGTDAFSAAANTSTSAFRGWGTVIQNCKFSRIRRGIYGRAACNAVVIMNNTWDTLCGGGEDFGAIEFNKFGDVADGNVLIGNLLEVKNYVNGIRLVDSRFNAGFGNSCFDPGPQFTHPVRLVGTASGNSFLGFFGPDTVQWSIQSTNSGRARGAWTFGGVGESSTAAPITVRPTGWNPAGPTNRMIEVSRSEIESTDAAAVVFTVNYDGSVTTTGRGSASPTWQISKSGSGNLTIDHQSIVRSTGDLLLYPGNTTSSKTRIMRGVFVLNTFATSGRPSASAASAGAVYYDTTLSMPVYSDGTNWRDAMGNIV
jgi:hypothetical protein